MDSQRAEAEDRVTWGIGGVSKSATRPSAYCNDDVHGLRICTLISHPKQLSLAYASLQLVDTPSTAL